MPFGKLLNSFSNPQDLTIRDNNALNLTPATQKEQDRVTKFVDPKGTGTSTDKFKKAVGVYPFTYKEIGEDGNFETKPGMIYVTKMNALNGGQPRVLGVETADASYTAEGGMDFLNKLRSFNIQSSGYYDTKTKEERYNMPMDLDDHDSVLQEFRNAIQKMRTRKQKVEGNFQQLQKLPTPDELKGTPVQQMPQKQQVPDPTPANSNPAWKWIWEYLAHLNNNKKA